MKNIMKEAHNLTKKIIRKGDSYRATFRICLSFVHSQIKKGVEKMLKGTEKQIKWAVDIKNDLTQYVNEAVEILEQFKSEATMEKSKQRHQRKIDILKNDLESINEIESAKEIIENYKHLQMEYTVDLMLNINKGQKIADLSL